MAYPDLNTMSRRSLKKQRKHKHRGTWKMIDDKTGFIIYSYEAIVDHRGKVTTKANYDPPSVTETEYLFPVPAERSLPFMRPEPEDDFIPQP